MSDLREDLAARIYGTMRDLFPHTTWEKCPVQPAYRRFADAALAWAIEQVAKEEEMDGEMPVDLWGRCVTREGAAEVMRAAVRATKRGITERLTPPPSESGKA